MAYQVCFSLNHVNTSLYFTVCEVLSWEPVKEGGIVWLSLELGLDCLLQGIWRITDMGWGFLVVLFQTHCCLYFFFFCNSSSSGVGSGLSHIITDTRRAPSQGDIRKEVR